MGMGGGAAAGALVLAVAGGLLLLVQPSDPPTSGSGPVPLTTAAPARVEYAWPTGDPVPVLRHFTAPPEPWAAGHRGVDLAMADGDQVRSAADGVVAFAGSVAGRGVVSVDHDDGLRTTYEPVAPTVHRGEAVARGEVIGTLAGLGHCTPQPCLHWGARRGSDTYVDPLSLVATEVIIRLLPMHATP